MSDLYEADFFGWANQQSTLLREGRVAEADLDHIAEEIEDMGRNRRQELRNRLAILLLHLLKWEHQPERRGRSCSSTITEQRARIEQHLRENPSLRPLLPDSIAIGYRYALLRIDRETGQPAEAFPADCPYAAEDVLGDRFLPGAP